MASYNASIRGRTMTYNDAVDYAAHIVVDRDIRFGKPVIKGTRIAVSDILSYMAAGDAEADILAEFPQITVDDIRACLAYAADRERLTHIAL
ncbi:MAG TPA: DUF433 domain-containing protein [Fimbriimonadaceae bacterium]|nr:DUF433 domain-containing protein [Fimbriimonadaceae bacterium]